MNAAFPDDFTWGVATSAYQIEGGRREGGKGDSIWDRFADEGRLPESGDVACDHYHRWREDVALIRDLGVGAYRFSVAWSRILPGGRGTVSPEGIAFYSDLIDALLEADITPWVTLYHWDLPQALQDAGGWADRATVDAFVAYADVLAAAFGDRVDHWITHNEPWVSTVAGHVDGVFAPGIRDWPTGLRVAHHLLLSHGRATEAIRRRVPEASVGIALDCRPARPASDDPADVAAARHFDGFRNRWFFDPVFGRGYPEDVVEAYRRLGRIDGPGLPFVAAGDMEAIAVPIDFLGINYYTSLDIAAGHEESEDTGVPQSANPPSGYTEMGWPITPDAFTEFLLHVSATYRPPSIVITENGASFSDGPGTDGEIHDDRRIDYLDRHIAAVGEAVAAGAPVDAYFLWSLLDNLEWTSGYSQRFGLVWVDHDTGERIPKDSFGWYRDLIGDLPSG